MHVQEEIIMDGDGIELSQGEYSAVSNEEARLLDLSAIMSSCRESAILDKSDLDGFD